MTVYIIYVYGVNSLPRTVHKQCYTLRRGMRLRFLHMYTHALCEISKVEIEDQVSCKPGAVPG